MQKKPLALLVCLLMFSSGCLGGSSEEYESKFHGDLVSPVKLTDDFNLLTSDNETYNFKNNTDGKVTVIAFLFTNCYDICPIVTYNMRYISESLNESQQEITEFITITVDPWRDNTSIMEEWKTRTKSNWTHLTVSNTDVNSEEMKTLNKVWADFGVGFKIEENQSATNTSGRHHPSATDYNIDHSTGTVLIDHEGNQRIWWGDFDWIIDLVKEDILTLVEEAEKP